LLGYRAAVEWSTLVSTLVGATVALAGLPSTAPALPPLALIRVGVDSPIPVPEWASHRFGRLCPEMTHSHTKKGRRGGMTAFQILREFLATGDTKYLAWWHEWEQATQGRKQETWSTETKKRNMDLRKIYGLEEDEQSDDEIAAEEVGDGEDLLQLPAETGKAIRRRAWELLDVIELEGLVGAERWLRARGLGYGRITLPGVAPP
jgi:hypothetical protein